MSQAAKPLKTVFILGAGVPGDQAVESQAVYFAGFLDTTYQMTFKRSGVPAQRSEAICDQSIGRIISQDLKWITSIYGCRTCGLPSNCKIAYQLIQ